MTRPSSDPLLRALLAELGGDDDATPPWRQYARRLLDARRRVDASPPCPTPVLRRAQGLFERRAPRVASALLWLVHDSWRGLAPAVRGAARPRDLRYEGDAGAVDVRLRRRPEGGWRVQVAVEPPGAGLSARIQGTAGGRARTTSLDAAGVGALTWKEAAGEAVLTIHRGETEVLRAAPVPLE